MELIKFISALVAGFVVIVWGADRFVIGAAATARNLGVSPLIIGLTIVGFGTSAPEILVALEASLGGNPHLAIGNSIGSNITNIALIIGATALVMPLTVQSATLKREFPILLAVTLGAVILLVDGTLSRLDGIILIVGLVAMVYWIVSVGLSARKNDPMSDEYDEEIPSHMPMARALFWLAAGFVLLIVSSKVLVWGGVGLAKYMGVSDLVIGLTIMAIGTSLPELAAAITSALKNEPDIAIGNVIGSNMFNILAVLCIPGLIVPGAVPGDVITRDLPIMAGLTILFFAMAYGIRRRGQIRRTEGALLLAAFIGYQVLIYFMSVGKPVVSS